MSLSFPLLIALANGLAGAAIDEVNTKRNQSTRMVSTASSSLLGQRKIDGAGYDLDFDESVYASADTGGSKWQEKVQEEKSAKRAKVAATKRGVQQKHELLEKHKVANAQAKRDASVRQIAAKKKLENQIQTLKMLMEQRGQELAAGSNDLVAMQNDLDARSKELVALTKPMSEMQDLHVKSLGEEAATVTRGGKESGEQHRHNQKIAQTFAPREARTGGLLRREVEPVKYQAAMEDQEADDIERTQWWGHRRHQQDLHHNGGSPNENENSRRKSHTDSSISRNEEDVLDGSSALADGAADGYANQDHEADDLERSQWWGHYSVQKSAPVADNMATTDGSSALADEEEGASVIDTHSDNKDVGDTKGDQDVNLDANGDGSENPHPDGFNDDQEHAVKLAGGVSETRDNAGQQGSSNGESDNAGQESSSYKAELDSQGTDQESSSQLGRSAEQSKIEQLSQAGVDKSSSPSDAGRDGIPQDTDTKDAEILATWRAMGMEGSPAMSDMGPDATNMVSQGTQPIPDFGHGRKLSDIDGNSWPTSLSISKFRNSGVPLQLGSKEHEYNTYPPWAFDEKDHSGSNLQDTGTDSEEESGADDQKLRKLDERIGISQPVDNLRQKQTGGESFLETPKAGKSKPLAGKIPKASDPFGSGARASISKITVKKILSPGAKKLMRKNR